MPRQACAVPLMLMEVPGSVRLSDGRAPWCLQHGLPGRNGLCASEQDGRCRRGPPAGVQPVLPVLPQVALADFLASGACDGHLRRLLEEDLLRLTRSIEACFPSDARVSLPAGEFALWVGADQRIRRPSTVR